MEFLSKKLKSRLNLNECVSFAIINFKDGCHVPTAITIIRCTEYSNHLLILQWSTMNKPFTIANEKDNNKNKWDQVFTWPQLYPSITSWWALAISFKLLVWLNCSDMSYTSNTHKQSTKNNYDRQLTQDLYSAN
jgi:hypothetical protein